MKTKLFSTVAMAFALAIHGQSQGYIIPNGVQYVGLNFAGGYEVDVLQNPTNGNSSGFWLTPQGKTPPTSPFINTFSFDYIVDEGVRVFLVSSNQPISQQAIQSGSYTELMVGNSYVFANNSPFYIGLYTGETFPQSGVYSDALFGWARLRNFQGAIEMLDGALAYNSQGIFAGTQTIIPEPSTFALIASTAVMLGWRKRHLR